MSFSCVPGTILGTASVKKAASALGKLTLWDQPAGSAQAAVYRPQPGGRMGRSECQENMGAALQRTEEQVLSWNLQ